MHTQLSFFRSLLPPLSYNYFRFEKQTSAILEFLFQLLPRLYHSNQHAILHQTTKFHPNRATRSAVMMSRTISSWWQWWLNTNYGFIFDDVTLNRKSKSIHKPNFVNQISSNYLNRRLRYNYFRFGTQTCTILEFFFPLRFWPDRCNLHILNQITKFR